MPEPNYLTNKEANALIHKRVKSEPINGCNVELIRYIMNTLAKVVNT